MQLAYELLPVMAGQDENLPAAVLKVRRRSRVYLPDESQEQFREHFHEPGFEDLAALRHSAGEFVEAHSAQHAR